ncbi:MAG TPA: LLM class F420-dependent oxidoreductase [Acidimicrobiales bacterium]|jgi:F420-dependent oxidoreductase-like protein|nr:LLM class F420-dependent oxidoreductase [Acidimicrobiales bacterium]
MTRLGYQIPNFTYPGVGSEGLFDAVARQAEAAERSGFDTVLVMDHFYQLPGLGPPENYMIECYTLLSALAQRTSTVRLSALVTGNTYRNPALLAKTVTALDIVSSGRAQLGIGAGWFELEHRALGFEFGTFTDRFEKLEEALQIILPMLRDERPTFAGRHYTVTDAVNQPPPVGRIPVMIGGAGERKTLRMVAQYADESNLICEASEIPRKLDALAAHCERLGRDRREIVVSVQRAVCIAPTHEQAVADATAYLRERGIDLDTADDATRQMIEARVTIGDPDAVGERLAAVLELGVDGFTCNLPANGHDPDNVELLGRTAAKLVA